MLMLHACVRHSQVGRCVAQRCLARRGWRRTAWRGAVRGPAASCPVHCAASPCPGRPGPRKSSMDESCCPSHTLSGPLDPLPWPSIALHSPPRVLCRGQQGMDLAKTGQALAAGRSGWPLDEPSFPDPPPRWPGRASAPDASLHLYVGGAGHWAGWHRAGKPCGEGAAPLRAGRPGWRKGMKRAGWGPTAVPPQQAGRLRPRQRPSMPAGRKAGRPGGREATTSLRRRSRRLGVSIATGWLRSRHHMPTPAHSSRPIHRQREKEPQKEVALACLKLIFRF